MKLNFGLAFGLFTAVAMLFTAPARAAVEKSVLVLSQGNGRQPSVIEFTSGFQQALATNFHGTVVVYIENLDLQQFNSPDYRREVAKWLRVKYQGRKLDAIVAENEQTADTAFKIRTALSPQTPLVFLNFERMDVPGAASQTNMTSILASPDVRGTLAAALRLCPDTRRIAFVSSGDNGYVEFYRRDLKRVEDFAPGRFEVIKLIGLTMAETRQRLATLPPQTIVFYDGIWIDGAGQLFTTRDALEQLSSVSHAPIFSVSDTYIGHGTVGGSCHVYFVLGREAANQVAAAVRAGSASSIPPMQSADNQLIFDWQQLHRYGLNENNLPPGSQVRFKSPTLWETYYRTVILVVAALVVQTGLIGALLIQRRRKRQAEAELFNSRLMLRTVLDTIPQRVFWKDRNSVFLGCNKPFARDYGFSDAKEMIGKTDYDTVAAPMADRYRADDREVMEANRAKLNYEEPQKKKDESTGWLRMNKVPLHDKDGRVIGVLGTYEDVTELKQAEEVLRESEQRFRSLLDNAPDAIYVQTKECIAYVNRAMLQLLRAERPEQLLGQPVLDMVAPEWREIVRERMQQISTKDGPLPMLEEEYLRADKSRVGVEVTAVPAIFQGDRGALVFVRDITERKRTAETIVYERELLRTLLDLLPDSVYIKDLDSRFLMANKTLAKRFGRDNPAQLIGLSDKDFFPAERAAILRAEEEKVIAGETINENEETFVLPDGQKRTLVVTKVPFRNSQGQICGLVGTGRDVTERKQLEEELRQSQKMEAFGQLAGGVAHDFNNLLTVILGHIALLQLQESLNPDQAAGLVEIAKAAERAANLTRQLLTFSRRQLFQPKPLDLNEVVANTSKMLQRLIGEHIGLETHFAPGGAPILADGTMMEQILINLAVNSRDAMSKGGRLIIQTAAVVISEADALANPKARSGAFIRLKVTDTGCGIGPKEMEHIFEPFFTTKEVGKGTGLGLATVFGIVVQHHGWIEVESKVNAGATFYIYLPRLPESEKSQTEFSRIPEVRGGNETILLVEDEAPVRSLARTLLEHKGYHVIEADSGLSALEIWQEQRDAIDLLFTDMVMPEGISGRELAARLLVEKPGLKVIYTSGYTDDMLGENSPLRNNPNFMEKPFDSHKLLKQVRDCLDGMNGS
ncbi:MAG: PAS domain-containing protein [Verrucomicrobiota bacterium]